MVIGPRWLTENEMTCRPARMGDSSAIALLMGQLGYSIKKEAVERTIEEFARSHCDAILIEEEAGRPVGVISCHIIPCLHQEAPLGRITSLVIHEAYRGKGIGSTLLKRAEEYFFESGCKRVEVTSSDKREQAHQFYFKQGFKVDERRFIKEYK